MESLKFNLQIDMFRTNNDDWENEDSFYCVFNEGHFRDTSSGNCYKWGNDYWNIGKA